MRGDLLLKFAEEVQIRERINLSNLQINWKWKRIDLLDLQIKWKRERIDLPKFQKWNLERIGLPNLPRQWKGERINLPDLQIKWRKRENWLAKFAEAVEVRELTCQIFQKLWKWENWLAKLAEAVEVREFTCQICRSCGSERIDLPNLKKLWKWGNWLAKFAEAVEVERIDLQMKENWLAKFAEAVWCRDDEACIDDTPRTVTNHLHRPEISSATKYRMLSNWVPYDLFILPQKIVLFATSRRYLLLTWLSAV